MEIIDIRHAWPEKEGFILNRPKGDGTIVFLHFHNSVEILVNGQTVKTRPNSCIFYGTGTPQWFESKNCWFTIGCILTLKALIR